MIRFGFSLSTVTSNRRQPDSLSSAPFASSQRASRNSARCSGLTSELEDEDDRAGRQWIGGACHRSQGYLIGAAISTKAGPGSDESSIVARAASSQRSTRRARAPNDFANGTKSGLVRSHS